MPDDPCRDLFTSWMEARRARVFTADLDDIMPAAQIEPEVFARHSELKAAEDAAERAYQECVARKWAERT